MKILFNTYKSAMQSPGGGEVIILKLHHYLKNIPNVQVDFFNMWEDKFEDYDLIHEFTTFNWDLWYLYKKMNLPFVVTPTMFPSNNPFAKLKEEISYQFKKISQRSAKPYSNRTAMNFPNLYTPTTELEAQRIKYFYNLDSKKFNVLPNGVDDLRQLPFESPNFDFSNYILFVGNISPIKNLLGLINAAEMLKLNLVVVGAAHPEHQDYYLQCKNHSYKNVTYMNRLDNSSPQLIGLYRNASCVVVPSQFETCSLVGLEAGILARPVVMTQNGGAPEVYRELVQYHDPQNGQSLVNAIEKSLASQHQSLELQKHIEQNYLWDKVANKLASYYQMVLAKNE